MIYSVCVSCGRNNSMRSLSTIKIVDNIDILQTPDEGIGKITLCGYCAAQFHAKYMERSVVYNLSPNSEITTKAIIIDNIKDIIESYNGLTPPSYKTLCALLNQRGVTTTRGGAWLQQNLQQFVERNGIDKNTLFFQSRRKLADQRLQSTKEENEPVTSVI